MTSVPEEVAELVQQRTEARAARNFALADALRDEIESRGFMVRDAAEGSTIEAKPLFDAVDPQSIRNELGDPPSLTYSLHVLYEGFLGDLERFLNAFAAFNSPADAEVVIVDPASGDGDAIERLAQQHQPARTLHLDRPVGWAAARNTGLKTSRGALIALVDLSVEPTGDILTAFSDIFTDLTIGVAGPFGLVSDDLREFRDASGPEVHAIEGYLLVARRVSFARELVNERFSWYRNADIDLSLQIRAQGLRAVVVDVPIARHEHRGWESLDPAQRLDRSRRNHALFYRRWKERLDLVTRVG